MADVDLLAALLAGLDGLEAGAPNRLVRELEHHLLAARLDSGQALSLAARGWFTIPWPEQHLVLRVHTKAVPAVDAFQPPAADLLAVRWWADEPACALGRRERDAHTYLCSWDLRAALGAAGEAPRFLVSSPTGVGLARLVVEARRRGQLRALLEASAQVRLQPAPRLWPCDPAAW